MESHTYRSDIHPLHPHYVRRFFKSHGNQLLNMLAIVLAVVFLSHVAAYHMQAGIPMFAVQTTILAFGLILFTNQLD